MSLQLSLETNTIFEKHKPEVSASGLLGDPDKIDGCKIPIILSRSPNLDKGSLVSENYIQLNRSEKTFFLLREFPKAFLLLTLIALRARRTPHPFDEVEIGEAYIGDWKSCGLSRKEYRTALAHLERQEILIILKTNRKCEKSATSRATKTTTKGTSVKLLNSEVWNINPEEDPHQKGHLKGHRGATYGPPRGHEQERIRKNKKEEEYIGSKDPLARTDSRPRKTDPIKFSFEIWKFEGISEQDIADWKVAYPNADIQKELAAQGQWLKANPTKAGKTKWRKFIITWLAKAHDQALNRMAYSRGGSPTSLNRQSAIAVFRDGERYDGAVCSISELSISFSYGATFQEFKFSDPDFDSKLNKMKSQLGVRS